MANNIAEDTTQLLVLNGTCYHRTVTTYKDPCGGFIRSTSSTPVPVPCGNDVGENYVYKTDVAVTIQQPCTSIGA